MTNNAVEFQGEYHGIPIVPVERYIVEVLFKEHYITKTDARAWLEREFVKFEEQLPIGIQPAGHSYKNGFQSVELSENHTVHILAATRHSVEFEEMWKKKKKWVTLDGTRNEVVLGKHLLDLLATWEA